MQHSGRLRLKPLVEDRHTLQVLRPKAEVVVRKICQKWEGYQKGESWMELSPQEKGQVGNTSSALSCPTGRTLRGPRCSNLIAGNSAQRHHPACIADQPTQPSSTARLCCLAGRWRLSQLSCLCSKPTGEVPQEPVPRAPFSLQVSKPGASV